MVLAWLADWDTSNDAAEFMAAALPAVTRLPVKNLLKVNGI